jgi:hypothetical protein
LSVINTLARSNTTLEKLSYYGIRKLRVPTAFIVQAPGECIIKHCGFVIYSKWADFVVSWWFLNRQLQTPAWTHTLAWTNALAYYGIRKLRIRNIFIGTGPNVIRLFFVRNLRIFVIS